MRRGAENSICGIFEDWLRHNAVQQATNVDMSQMSGSDFLKLVYKDWPLEHTLYEGGL